MISLGMMTARTARVRQEVSAVIRTMRGPRYTNACKDLAAIMRGEEGTSKSWQRRMLDSEMYADVMRNLRGVEVGKAKVASLKRLIKSAANRKLERNIKKLDGTRGK